MPLKSTLPEVLLSTIFSKPIIAVTGLFIVAAVLCRWLLIASSDDAPSIPLYTPQTVAAGNYKQRWSYDNPNTLQEAYSKNRDRLFKIWTSQGKQLAVPARYLDELKMLPDTKLPSSLRSFFLGPYLWPVDQRKLDYVQKGLHKDLNKHLPTMFLEAREGAEKLIPFEFPECQDWMPLQIYPRVLRLVSRINAKILVGNDLQENEEWIDISASYTRNIFLSSAKLRIFHPVLRPMLQFFIPELRKVWHCNRRARDILAPILTERVRREKENDFKKPLDSIEWLRDDANDPKDKDDPHLHAIVQLIIGALSVNTTSQLITNCIYNLASRSEYVPVLRQEIDDTLRDCKGTWTMENMAQLQKLDSFIKETLRHSGHLTMTFQRTALKNIPLSDGAQLPEGYTVFSPANAINFDPEIYPDPDTFDGLRFYELRHAVQGDEKKFQLTSITKEQMQFGMGRHACPGRWIASHQVKLILAQLLTKYDLGLEPGKGRPKTVLFQTNQFPDPQGQILFKNRK